MRVALKMSGLKAVSVEPGPLISIRPNSTTAMPTANKMKFILSKAKFFLSMFVVFVFVCWPRRVCWRRATVASTLMFRCLFTPYNYNVRRALSGCFFRFVRSTHSLFIYGGDCSKQSVGRSFRSNCTLLYIGGVCFIVQSTISYTARPPSSARTGSPKCMRRWR